MFGTFGSRLRALRIHMLGCGHPTGREPATRLLHPHRTRFADGSLTLD